MYNRNFAVFGGEPLFNQKKFTTKPVVPSIEELNPFLQDIFKRAWLSNNGKYLIEFENRLCEYLKVERCSVFCNGTLSLILAMKALELTGEVITTPFTFPATIHSIKWNGLTPVFCDIEPDTFNIDVKKIESLITPLTTAIIPVHVFGNPCDVEKIDYIASKHNLKVIYDAAHAFGVKYQNKPIGNYGDISIFSFHASKLFNTLEGGGAVAKNIEIDKKLRDLRNFGIRSEEEVSMLGINAKMNELQAVFGLINLPKVENTIEKRKVIFEKYYKALKDVPGISFQKIRDNTLYNYSYLSIKIDEHEFGLSRDAIYHCMRKEGVMVRRYFWPLCSNFAFYKSLRSAKKEFLNNANKIADNILILPLYEQLRDSDINKIIDLIIRLNKESSTVKRKLNNNYVKVS